MEGQTLSKLCSKCRTVKPTSDFHKQTNSKDGLNYCCKKCIGIIEKNYLFKLYKQYGLL